MAKSGRWAYMTQSDYNPPNLYCPHCETPSKTYFIGGKRTPEGRAQVRWKCSNLHEWVDESGDSDSA